MKRLITALYLMLGTITLAQTSQPASVPASQATSQPTTSSQPKAIIYNGKERDQKWFDQQFAYFKDKIIKLDNTYLDIGIDLAEHPKIPDSIGLEKIITISSRAIVYKILSNSEFLMFTSVNLAKDKTSGNWNLDKLGRGNLIYIKGFDTSKLAELQPFRSNCMLWRYGEEYLWKGHWGLPNYRLVIPLTKEEFREALDQGLKLVQYSRVNDKVVSKPIE